MCSEAQEKTFLRDYNMGSRYNMGRRHSVIRQWKRVCCPQHVTTLRQSLNILAILSGYRICKLLHNVHLH